jgi:hypothetical protein
MGDGMFFLSGEAPVNFISSSPKVTGYELYFKIVFQQA